MSGAVPDEADRPKVFITSWIDYTHKYGTAYQLTDGSAGVYFNDSTTMILAPNKTRLDYITNRKSATAPHIRRNYSINEPFTDSPELKSKLYLLKYFQEYMSKTLEKQTDWTFVDEKKSKHMDFLVKYYRMKSAIVFKLSNDVIQVCFVPRYVCATHASPTVQLLRPLQSSANEQRSSSDVYWSRLSNADIHFGYSCQGRAQARLAQNFSHRQDHHHHAA